MTRGHRIAAVLVVAGLVLVCGRIAAVVYTTHEWFVSLGAESVWLSQLGSTVLLYGLAFVAGTVFAWFNISAVRRSVVALIVPKRLANVEFGEEIPSSRLRLVTGALSVASVGLSMFALPSWSVVAVWLSRVTFAESDPYFNLDLSHFVSWLPLESAIYGWCITLFAIVTAVILGLYALTPSLSWSRRGLRMAGYARRHLSVLGAVLVLLAAWGFRLDAFNTLIEGSGVAGAFTRVDHVWLVPADLGLSLVTVGAAVVLLASGWMGQVTTAFITVTVVIAGIVVTQLALPLLARLEAEAPDTARGEQPYLETRDAYTERAFPREGVQPSERFAASPVLLANAGRLEVRGAIPDIAFPGARGTVLVPDPARHLEAPRLGTGIQRLMHSWAEQNPRLFQSAFDSSAALVWDRDVRQRVHAIAPVLSQSRSLGAVPTAAGVLWMVDLYATSSWYPLSAPHEAPSGRITYRHHAATAYVSGGTGATFIVPDSALDPIARAWFSAHPGRYLTSTLPSFVTEPPAVPARVQQQPGARDSGFRTDVMRMYQRMRAALDSGDLAAFGKAFDSLGLVVAGRK